MKALILTLTLMIPLTLMKTTTDESSLKSRAELTDYRETSRYEDVLEFIGGLQRLSDVVKVETFGVTNEGRPLPLVILSRPGIDSPARSVARGGLMKRICRSGANGITCTEPSTSKGARSNS